MQSNASSQRTGDSLKSGLVTKPSRPNRPPNGFLLFCHRHRPIVRRYNKNIENRLVTKILGQWWATLGDAEKAPYEEKAREYREYVYGEFPTYKWHTPKESSGNSPVTRQSHRSRPIGTDPGSFPLNSVITPGKLADLSQMGNLSSLMVAPVNASLKRIFGVSYIANEHDYLSIKPPVDNNNTIAAGEELPCTNGGCEHISEDSGINSADIRDSERLVQTADKTVFTSANFLNPDTCAMPEDNKIEYLKVIETKVASDKKNLSLLSEVESGAAKKRKTFTPKKINLGVSAEHCGSGDGTVAGEEIDADLDKSSNHLSFREFLRGCPTYCYDEFQQKKAEGKKTNKKYIKKRKLAMRKDLGAGELGEGRSETGIPRARRIPRSTRLSEYEAVPLEMEAQAAEDVKLSESPPKSGLDLLICAVETLEDRHFL